MRGCGDYGQYNDDYVNKWRFKKYIYRYLSKLHSSPTTIPLILTIL